MLSQRLRTQALSESANAMLQFSQDSIIVADIKSVPKVWHGLTILHQQTSHMKVGKRLRYHAWM